MDFPYERDAMRGEPMPNGLDGADRLYYLQLVYLYHVFHTGKWTREQSAAEKQKFLRERAVNKANLAMYQEAAQMRGKIGTAISAFSNEKTVENAQTVFDIWDGLRGADKE